MLTSRARLKRWRLKKKKEEEEETLRSGLRKEIRNQNSPLCKWQRRCDDVLERFQLCGEHLPTHSLTPTHTDPQSGWLWRVMSCLTAGCRNHNKQFLWSAERSPGTDAQGTERMVCERAHSETGDCNLAVMTCFTFSPGSSILSPDLTTGSIKFLCFSLLLLTFISHNAKVFHKTTLICSAQVPSLLLFPFSSAAFG